MADFQRSFTRVLVYEGGNADDPIDPGGRTSRGITQAVYNAFADKHSLARSDIWKVSDATISLIYRENYWNRISGDKLSDGVALCIFDAAVNSGISQTAKWVQRSLKLRVDGDFGPITRNAIINCQNQAQLIRDVCSRRLAMLKSLPTWKRYGKGWQARVTDVQRTALAWATQPDGSFTPSLDRVQPTPKAEIKTKAKPVDQSAPNATVAVGGIGTVIASLATVFSDAADKLSPLVATWPRIAEVCAALTVISVIATLYISLRHRQHDAIIDGSAQASVEG